MTTRYFASRSICIGTGKAGTPRMPEPKPKYEAVAKLFFFIGFGIILLVMFAKVWDLKQRSTSTGITIAPGETKEFRFELTPRRGPACDLEIFGQCVTKDDV